MRKSFNVIVNQILSTREAGFRKKTLLLRDLPYIHFHSFLTNPYSHLFNKRGGWNKRGGGAKVAKSLNMEAGINMEGGIFWKKLVHKSNKRGVEGGKI